MRALFASLLTVAALALASCTPAAAPNPALWRIADADSEIWIFGSVHVLPPNLRWRSERVNAAFAAAEEFVTETDAGPNAPANYQALAARYGSLPEGETLWTRLTLEDSERLQRIARENDIDPAALSRLRPWLAALQLSYAALARAGQRADAGVEAVLHAEARASGKRLSFLETPEEQVRVLADLAPADEAHFLSLTLDEIEQGTAGANEMDSAWSRGDIAELERQLNAQWRETGPAIHSAVIVNRNRNWADQLAARLEGEGTLFIAVGAAHLLGDDSLIALLRARGIEVEGP